MLEQEAKTSCLDSLCRLCDSNREERRAWLANYAVLGPCDYLDIFDAPDHDTATKVTLLVRSLGHATTETWVVTPWDRFLNLAQGLRQ